jgi:hypothetical protein
VISLVGRANPRYLAGVTYWAPGGFATAADLAALQASVASLQGKVEPLETLDVSGAAISGYTFSDLAGAQRLRIVLSWVKGALSASALLIRPNGITTDQLTLYSQGDAGGAPGDLSFAGLVLATGNRGPAGSADVHLDLATGRQRTGVGLFGVGGDETVPTSNRNCYSYLLWDDMVTAVTSITIACIDTGTLLASSDMLPGTSISVFKEI